LTLKLAIENFKSIEKVELELEDVTVLVGPPAAGKSNILDALAVLGYFNRFKVLDREYGNSGANLEPLSHIARFQSAEQLFRYRDLTNPVRL
jgi:predicted ATP-dependent endonuclease of OLD family